MYNNILVLNDEKTKGNKEASKQRQRTDSIKTIGKTSKLKMFNKKIRNLCTI